MENKIKKIGVLTSGGDAPGMNAAIRAVTRTAIYNGIQVVGIRKGYEGLANGDFINLESKNVSEILHRGGTVLLTARYADMNTEKGIKKCSNIYDVLGLDALVVIGGDGSLRGGNELRKQGVNIIGIPATIDLDLPCTEYTIGFDTAVTTAMDAIGKIRDTSTSHERCSIVEVMGRNAGHIALWCALTVGSEEVLIPEHEEHEKTVIQQVLENRAKGKKHNLIIVAEGVGGSQELAKKIEEKTRINTRATILGHLQRGGSPTALDRMHASMMGYNAIQTLLRGEKNKVMIYKSGKYTEIDLDEAIKIRGQYNDNLYDIIKILAM